MVGWDRDGMSARGAAVPGEEDVLHDNGLTRRVQAWKCGICCHGVLLFLV